MRNRNAAGRSPRSITRLRWTVPELRVGPVGWGCARSDSAVVHVDHATENASSYRSVNRIFTGFAPSRGGHRTRQRRADPRQDRQPRTPLPTTRLHIPASVNCVNTYSGPARLILVDGTRVPGTASLKLNPHGRTPGWGGTFRPDQTTAATQDAANGLQIELPYEQVGEVTVTGTRRLLATQILMSLAGRGPAPF